MSENSKFSRRDFLKLSPFLPVGLAIVEIQQKMEKFFVAKGLDYAQPKIVDLGLQILENPQIAEESIGVAANNLETLALSDERAHGAPEIEVNLKHRPMLQIIQEVFEKRENAGKKIIFNRIPDYKSSHQYFEETRNRLKNPELRSDRPEGSMWTEKDYIFGFRPDVFNTILYENESSFFPKGAMEIWIMSDSTNIQTPQDLLVQGSGIRKFVENEVGKEFLQKSINAETAEFDPTFYKTPESIDKSVKKWLGINKDFVEKLVLENNNPISAGLIFEKMLNDNDGDVVMSLMDITLFLKYMARQDSTLRNISRRENGIEMPNEELWYQRNILDEYGKVGNFQELPQNTYPYWGLLSRFPNLSDVSVDKDLHLLNQIGKAYHAWNEILLLAAFPPTVIQGGVLWRNVFDNYGDAPAVKSQGPVKLAADFNVALELRNIEEMLMKYQK